MSFFKDFKDDLSTAADELMFGNDPAKETSANNQDLVVDTFANDGKNSDMGQIDDLLEKVSAEPAKSSKAAKKEEKKVSAAPAAAPTQSVAANAPDSLTVSAPQSEKLPVSDETTVITAGTVIRGDIEAAGSLDISGEIAGDVKCRGKLTVTGTITGNSSAEEVFADSAHIAGEIVSNGTVKIGLGSVIVGNVTANSAVVAGAIKGDIDVHGPVVVDTSAVVMGNIKSRSVQINNGAVIEGFCSQAYADIDVDSLFGQK